MRIEITSRFKRSYKKLPSLIRNDFDKRISVFFRDPFDLSLNTHKLRGNLDLYYAFYLRDGYRALFVFEEENHVLLINIGSHDDYAKWAKK